MSALLPVFLVLEIITTYYLCEASTPMLLRTYLQHR